MNIKSSVFAALLLLGCFSDTLRAQSTYKMGFTLGGSYSTLSSNLFNTSSGRLSPAAGFSIALGFGDHLELLPEIMFVQKGAIAKTVKYNSENEPTTNTYHFYYNTFEAGVFAGVQPFKNVPLRFQAGGFFGANFHRLDRSQRDEFVSDYENVVNATQVTLLNESMAGIDFGPAFGISAGMGRFNVAARYYRGARNLYDNIAYVSADNHIRSHAFRLSVTYYFKHKSEWD